MRALLKIAGNAYPEYKPPKQAPDSKSINQKSKKQVPSTKEMADKTLKKKMKTANLAMGYPPGGGGNNKPPIPKPPKLPIGRKKVVNPSRQTGTSNPIAPPPSKV